MKKLTFLLILMSHIFYAQQKVTITGTVKNFKGKSVVAETVKESIKYEVLILDSTKLNSKGAFTLSFEVKKPIEVKLTIGEEYTILFVAPSDKISLTLDAKKFDESIKYTGSHSKWNQFVAHQMNHKNWNFPSSIFKLNEKLFLDSLNIFYQDKISNAKDIESDQLRNYLLQMFDFESMSNKLKYSSYHKYYNKLDKKPELSIGYYDFANKIEINKESVLAFSERNKLVSDLLSFWTTELYEKDTNLNYDSLQITIIESRLKGDVKDMAISTEIYNTLAYEFNLDKASKFEEKFSNDLKNQVYKDAIQSIKLKVKKYAKGALAPSFSFPDMNGKMVSLSDFKGKIVYLDVWASWCGPCRREIPAAKELEKQMHGKDVVFLCVSVDGDEAAWKKIVKEKELTGIHIHSKGDFKSEMTKLYDINSIPTYIIIDRNGKIWKMGAERPSGKAKEELEEALK